MLLERPCVLFGKNHASKTFAKCGDAYVSSSCVFRFQLFHSLRFTAVVILSRITSNVVIVVSERSGGDFRKITTLASRRVAFSDSFAGSIVSSRVDESIRERESAEFLCVFVEEASLPCEPAVKE